MVRDSYVIDDKSVDSWALFNSGNDFGTLYSGSSLTDGNVLAHSTSPSLLIYRTKSGLEAASEDSINYLGTESIPSFEIGWGLTIDTTTLAGVSLDSATYSTAIINRSGTSGTWYSPEVQINATNLSKLSWNEELGVAGDVVFDLRTATTEGGIATAAFSSDFTTPSGSDVSGVTANDWVQIRATLSTTDIDYSPEVTFNDNFVIKLSYSSEGSNGETSVLTLWESGFNNFGTNNPKRIKEVQIFYEGTSGTLSTNITNAKGDVDHTFTLDLSVSPSTSTNDNYFGDNTNKIYRYFPVVGDEDNPVPFGRYFKFLVTENGITPWKIHRVVVVFDVNEYVTFKGQI